MSIDAFPLSWPSHWPRTKRRSRSQFKVSFAQARDGLIQELQRMGAKGVVISTNIELRRDGLPYANRPEPDDTGVCVYFHVNGVDKAIPCDKWDRTRDNLRAIEHMIAALRGLERWGAKNMVDAAFQGFDALPAHSEHGWWVMLDVRRDESIEQVEARYRFLLKQHHPDMGGDVERFHQIQSAYDEFKRERGDL